MTYVQRMTARLLVMVLMGTGAFGCGVSEESNGFENIVILMEEMPEPDAGTMPEPEPEPEPEPMGPACDAPGYSAEYERMAYTAEGGVTLTSYSKRPTSRNPVIDILLLEFHMERGFVMEPGRYDLAEIGADLNDCQICVVGLKGQNISQRTRDAVLMATQGIVEITSDGTDGQPFEASFEGVLLEEVNVTQNMAGGLNVEMVESDAKWCLDEFQVSTMIREPPAEIGEEIRDFQVQNCETGEMVNIYEASAGYDAVWIFGTAGWCPACKTMLFKGSAPRGVPSMFQAVDNNPGLKGMIILGENSSRSQATVTYCQRHANYYRQGWAEQNPGVPLPTSLEDASMFYVDHDGVNSFDQLFGSLKVYLNEQGAFGLPWNATLEPGDPPVYRYADGSGQPESLGETLEGLGINLSVSE